MRSRDAEASPAPKPPAKPSPRPPNGSVAGTDWPPKHDGLRAEDAYVQEALEVADLMEQLRGPR